MTKKSGELINEICGYLKEGHPREDSCQLCKISKSTLHLWMREDPEIKAQVKQAESEAVRVALGGVWKAGKKDPVYYQWWLERTLPQHFSKHTRITPETALEVLIKHHVITPEIGAWLGEAHDIATERYDEELEKILEKGLLNDN